MLVGYSSSSEEDSEAAEATEQHCSRKCEEEDDNGRPASKKPRIEEQLPKTRCVVTFCRPEQDLPVTVRRKRMTQRKNNFSDVKLTYDQDYMLNLNAKLSCKL